MMQPIAGGALARPFVTHHNALDMELYLRIAPELYLKRLTVGGLERVFEINRNFRNEGISTQHNPEFTMMEFYEAYADYQRLMTMTEELIATVAQQAIGTDQITFGEHQISLAAPFARLSLREGAREAASRRLEREVADGRPARSRTGRRRWPRELGLEVEPGHGAGQDRHDDLRGAVRGPADSADLRLRLSDRGVAAVEAEAGRSRHRRAFELYIGGFEVANAFSELNDPVEQRRRFEAQLQDRAQRRSRSARDGRGLHPRARVRPAADRRRRRRHRSPGDAADQQPVDPRRDPVSADAEARLRRRPTVTSCAKRRQRCLMEMPFELHIALRYLLAKRKQAFISVISLHLDPRRHRRRDGAGHRAGADDRPAAGAARPHPRLEPAHLRLEDAAASPTTTPRPTSCGRCRTSSAPRRRSSAGR